MNYLLDTGVLLPFFKGRQGAVTLVKPLLSQHQLITSIVIYGEMIEYLKSQPDYQKRRNELRLFLNGSVPAYGLTYAIVERYAELRRAMRPPYGPGLIGDIDTLIAATALERNCTLLTANSDYERVPGLKLQRVTPASLR
jgi:predicted nucleic acid-binding protein